MDGTCDVPDSCSFGDYRDCGMTVPGLNATLPEAIGSLVCRSKITRMYCSALPGLRITSVVARARHSIRRSRLQGLLGCRPGGQHPLEHLRANRTHVAVRPVRPPCLASGSDAGASHGCLSAFTYWCMCACLFASARDYGSRANMPVLPHP